MTERKKRMKKMEKLQRYFLYFMMYSILGWIYEVFLEVVVYRWGFSDRGILFGPYCVIYGFGALLLLTTLTKLKNKKICAGKIPVTPILVFLGIIIVTTITELIGSYIMEWLTGDWMWDYDRFAFDFQGRIAPNPSIRFGIGGMVILYLIQPLLEKATGRISSKKLKIISGALAVLLLADLAATVILRETSGV